MNGNFQKKPVVYLDSSFVSRLAGGRTKANHVLAQQAASRKWWSLMREQVQPVVSVLVWTEIVRGDAGCVARRKDVIRGLPWWEVTPEATALAGALIRKKAIEKCKSQMDDALHIATAAVGGADILLSWNFKHIVNRQKMPLIKSVVERAGYRCPLLSSPKQELEKRT